MGDKFHCQKGNSPDPQLRSPSIVKWKRMWNCTDNQDVGLEASAFLMFVTEQKENRRKLLFTPFTVTREQ